MTDDPTAVSANNGQPAKTPEEQLPDPSQDDEDVLVLIAAYFLLESGE